MNVSQTLESVKEYYGKVLSTSDDLKTNACCTNEALAPHLKEVLKLIHDEVKAKYYGCGIVIPDALEGITILDLGSGSGRDCYILSKLVGPNGNVIGIDMTDEQLEVANRHRDFHAQKFGHTSSNVTFLKGYIEDLESVGIPSDSVDLVVSNCVLNLSPAKDRVFKEIFRVLKPGGELYFSDVFSDRRIPKDIASDPVLLGECLGGAMYKEDFRRLLLSLGCKDFRVVSKSPLDVTSPSEAKKVGNIKFESITIRAFKMELEDKCEDYGQVAYYLGTIPEAPHKFKLDDHHIFEKGRPMLVCSNTAAMLSQSRYKRHFRIEGDLSTHFGLFPCGPSAPISLEVSATNCSTTGGGCC